MDDLALRVPELRKDEMKMLAEVGALNPLRQIHRRDALWMAERAVRPVGPCWSVWKPRKASRRWRA